MHAYAIELKEENLQAIASEMPGFSFEQTRAWMKDGDGYFIRDEGEAFDCKFIYKLVFDEIYRIQPLQQDALFKQITRI